MKTALVLACDDNFVPYACTVARRAAHLSSERFPIVILSDGVSEENKRHAQRLCSRIAFIEASNLFAGKEFRTAAAITRSTYLRLYLDEVLADFTRVVYLDGDMTPLVDLAPLLHMVPRAAPVMAAYSLDHKPERTYASLPLLRDAGYLQAGLQIYDLKAVREERILKDAIKFALEHPETCGLGDQDAINVVLQGRWQVLDWRWNVMNKDARFLPSPFYIRHHGGPSKPWSADKSECEPHIVRKWREDLEAGPWAAAFVADRRRSFVRKYLRPITRAVEVPVKAALRGDFDTVLRGEREQRQMRRYMEQVPSMLKKIEEAAREGRLAKALDRL